MKSLILDATTRLLMGLLLIFSVFMLLRGHNLPGGGFPGGLLAAAAFALKAVATDAASARRTLGIDPIWLIGIGLALGAGSGMAAWFEGLPFLTGLWNHTPLPAIGKFSSPLVFDIGVYLLVAGGLMLIIFSLEEDGEKEERGEGDG